MLSLKQPSDSELGKALQKQTSLQRQTSEAVGGSKKDVPAKDLAEKQKEWDKDLPNVPVSRILRYSLVLRVFEDAVCWVIVRMSIVHCMAGVFV